MQNSYDNFIGFDCSFASYIPALVVKKLPMHPTVYRMGGPYSLYFM